MLDAVLSTKGWGAAEFEAATPEFLAAARYAVVAEKHGPTLARLDGLANQRVPFGLPPDTANALLDDRLEAHRAAILIRGALFEPESEEEKAALQRVIDSLPKGRNA